MPLMNKFRKLHSKHFKTVKDTLKWYDDTLNDKNDNSIIHITNENLLMGKFYRFYYRPIDLIKLPFYDMNPLIISLGESDSKTELGLNLNILPYDVRIFIINEIYRTFKYDIDSEVKNNKNDFKKQSYLSLDYDTLKNMFPNLNIKYAVRNYLKQNRYNTTAISYDHFVRLPFIENYSFAKKTISEVHMNYYISVKNKNNAI